MAQPTDIVTSQAMYNTPYYAMAPVLGPTSAVGQFSTGGSAYNQVNPQYLNTTARMELGLRLPAGSGSPVYSTN